MSLTDCPSSERRQIHLIFCWLTKLVSVSCAYPFLYLEECIYSLGGLQVLWPLLACTIYWKIRTQKREKDRTRFSVRPRTAQDLKLPLNLKTYKVRFNMQWTWVSMDSGDLLGWLISNISYFCRTHTQKISNKNSWIFENLLIQVLLCRHFYLNSNLKLSGHFINPEKFAIWCSKTISTFWDNQTTILNRNPLYDCLEFFRLILRLSHGPVQSDKSWVELHLFQVCDLDKSRIKHWNASGKTVVNYRAFTLDTNWNVNINSMKVQWANVKSQF